MYIIYIYIYITSLFLSFTHLYYTYNSTGENQWKRFFDDLQEEDDGDEYGGEETDDIRSNHQQKRETGNVVNKATSSDIPPTTMSTKTTNIKKSVESEYGASVTTLGYTTG